MADRALRVELESLQAEVRALREDVQRETNSELMEAVTQAQVTQATRRREHQALEHEVSLAQAARASAQRALDDVLHALRREEQLRVAGGALLAVVFFGVFAVRTSLEHHDETGFLLGASFGAALVLGGWWGLRQVRGWQTVSSATRSRPFVGIALITLTLLAAAGFSALTLFSIHTPQFFAPYNWSQGWSDTLSGLALGAVRSPATWAVVPYLVIGGTTWSLVRQPLHPRAREFAVSRAIALITLATNASFAGWVAQFTDGSGWAMGHDHRFVASLVILAVGLVFAALGISGVLERRVVRPLEAAQLPAGSLAVATALPLVSLWLLLMALMTYTQEAQAHTQAMFYEAGWDVDTDYTARRNLEQTWASFGGTYWHDEVRQRAGRSIVQAVAVYGAAGLTATLGLLAGLVLALRRRALPLGLRFGPLALSVLALGMCLLDAWPKYAWLLEPLAAP